MQDAQSTLRKLLANELLISLKAYPLADTDVTHSPNDEIASSPSLQLDKPSCIAHQLEAIGVPSPTATKISSQYLTVASQLYAACQSSYQDTVKSSSQRHLTQKTVESLSQALLNFYAQKTRTWIEVVMGLARSAIESAATQPLKTDGKPFFNHEYTPVLEKYFEYNAYPSTSDKIVLAKKSNMTLRQIEVWFQNHRNRSKKEGKTLRKLADDAIHPPLKSFEQSTSFSSFLDVTTSQPTTLKCTFPDEEGSVSQSTVFKSSYPSDISAPPRPSHVFPAMYSPHGCLPTSRGAHKFPPPVWHRSPTATPHDVKIQVDIDQLVKEFDEKLHFGTTSITSRQRPKTTSKPWWATRVTIPSPAPLPALLRLHVTSSSNYAQQIPVLSTRPRPFSISTPSPPSQVGTPPQQESRISVRKKTARLPRRMPKNASIAHRRGSPTRPSASPASFRISSSSSSSSSYSGSEPSLGHSRLASDSSSSSLASSRPATPVSPEGLHPPVIPLPRLDFKHADLFGQYGPTSDFDSKTIFASSPNYQQYPVTFESLDGLLMSVY